MTTNKIFKVFRGKSSDIPILRHDGYIYFTTDQGKLYIDAEDDGIIKRNIINQDTNFILSNTTQGWNNQSSLISKSNTLYIYTDYYQSQNNNIPGIKIGDGKAYLIDLPFIDSLLMDHINNNTIHITEDQRSFWNEKIRCYLPYTDTENIVFTTD